MTALRNRRVAALVYDRLCTFEFGIAVEIFALPRPELSVDWYEFAVCSLDLGPLRATGGVRMEPTAGLGGLRRAGTIVIPGWRDPNERPPDALLNAVRAAHARGARLVTICSGVFVLAAAGLLDGKRATTHWRYVDRLRELCPRIRVEPDVLYVDEGTILTSAGSAAGIDLCLHIVRRDYGANIANQVARRLIMPPQREGGQSQYIPAPIQPEAHGGLAHVLEWAHRHLSERLSVERLAQRAAMSPRRSRAGFARRQVRRRTSGCCISVCLRRSTGSKQPTSPWMKWQKPWGFKPRRRCGCISGGHFVPLRLPTAVGLP